MKIKPLKILVVASWYPSHVEPVYGSFVQEQVNMLKERGHDITVLHPVLNGTFWNAWKIKSSIQKENYFGVDVIRVKASPYLPRNRKLAYRRCLLLTLKAINVFNLPMHEFDVIHSHSAFLGGIIGHKLATKFNVKQVHTEHTSGLVSDFHQYNRSDRSVLKNFFEQTDLCLFVSTFSMKETLRNCRVFQKSKHRVLHNMVEDTFFDVIDVPPVRPFRYLVISNLIPRKNVSLILEAWKRLISEFPSSTLTIAGDGPSKKELIDFTHKNSLSDSVIFENRLKRTQVKEAIDACHVMLSSSEIETFGLTVAEAQAAGRPVVVTDSGGVRDIVTDKTGIITSFETEDFAKGLIKIQKDYHLFDAHKIQALTKEKFSSEILYKQLMDLYATVLF